MSEIDKSVFHMIFGKPPTVTCTKMQTVPDVESMLTLVGFFRPHSFLEIGINYGETAKMILDYASWMDRYVGIDVTEGYKTPLDAQRNEVPKIPGQMARGDSRLTLIVRPNGSVDVTPQEIGKVDMVLVDGDHSYEGVKRDTLLAESVVRNGGVILWHDYAYVTDVHLFIDERNNIRQRTCLIQGTNLCFEVIRE